MAIQDIDPRHLQETGRFKELDRLERYYRGTQYDNCHDLVEWDNDSVPMRSRKPCIIYPLPRGAVDQVVRFALGEGRFPRIRAEVTEPEEEFAPQMALDEDSAESLGSSLEDLIRVSRFKSAARTSMRAGLRARTSVLTMGVRGGRFVFEHPSAKDCIPTFRDGDPSQPVESLIWSYQYDAIEPDETGHPKCVRYAFRRDYDAASITQYAPAKVEPGRDIKWSVESVTAHGLGECPIIWTRNMCEDTGTEIDGVSLYDGLLDEFDALNRSLSQRHRGLEVLGVPQPYETNVQDGDGPGQAGRTAAVRPSESRAPTGPAGYSKLRQRGGNPARKTGAQHMWSYEGGAELGLLETTGKAFEVASKHVDDIRGRLLEAMTVIIVDHMQVAGKGDMSAKALSLMYAPMLALVDELREWWWSHFIEPAVEMMLRIASRLGPKRLLVKGAASLSDVLAKRDVTLDGGLTMWSPPRLSPLWGAYFAAGPDDTKTSAEAARTALDGKLISKRTAVRWVADDFGIGDVEEELEAIAEEAAEAQAQALAMMPEPGEDPAKEDQPIPGGKPGKPSAPKPEVAKPAKGEDD